MLIEDISQGMVERKRLSQELMQTKRSSGTKRDMSFLFDNQPYDPRDTFRGELARRAMMTGELPLGRGMKADMYGFNWLKKQQGDLLDIAIERQTLNDELIPNIPLDVFGKKKELKQYLTKKDPQMKYFVMQNKENENAGKAKKKRRTADQEIAEQQVMGGGRRLKNNKNEEVNQNQPLSERNELNESEKMKIKNDWAKESKNEIQGRAYLTTEEGKAKFAEFQNKKGN